MTRWGGGTNSTSGTEEPAGTEKPAETGKTDENDDEDPVVDKRYIGVLWNSPLAWDDDISNSSFIEKKLVFSFNETTQKNAWTFEEEKTYSKIGIQLVDANNLANTEITSPVAASSVFSLSDDGVYLWDNTSKSILKATLSDTGYNVTTVLEHVDTIADTNISSDDKGDYSFNQVSALTYYDGWMYFAAKYGSNWDTKYFICAIKLNDINNSFVYSYVSYPVIAMGIYKDSNNQLSLIYSQYSYFYEQYSTYIRQISFDSNQNIINLGNNDNESVQSYGLCDFTIIGDVCYGLVRNASLFCAPLDYYGKAVEYDYNTNEDRYTTYSYGGLVKVNLNTGNIENWSSENVCLGMYTSNGNRCTPPLSEADKYFYGPRKIIAIKPDVLYIADDGYYLDLGKDGDKLVQRTSKNMNRIVTVNLKTESLSAEDAKVGFSNSIEYSSAWFILK